MFSIFLSIIFSFLCIVFIKKVFYRSAALHPWIFSILIYYPSMLIWNIILALALLESNATLPNAVYFCSVFIAYAVFRGGKKTQLFAQNIRDNKLASSRKKDISKIEETLKRIPSDSIPDFSQYHFDSSHLAIAIFSLCNIDQVPFSENNFIRLLNYLHNTLIYLVSNPDTPSDISYIDFSRKNYFDNFQSATRSLVYVRRFLSDNSLVIDSTNVFYLDSE